MGLTPLVKIRVADSAGIDRPMLRIAVLYIIFSDTVNLASRIQGMTKDLDWDILISGETRRLLSERFSVKYVRTVQVRGKKEQTDLFKVF